MCTIFFYSLAKGFSPCNYHLQIHDLLRCPSTMSYWILGHESSSYEGDERATIATAATQRRQADR